MEPLSMIVGAVVAGATAALKSSADDVVKDAYEALAALVKKKFAGVRMGLVAQDPKSEKNKQALTEDLQRANADRDREVLERAKALLSVVKRDAEAVAAGGLTINEIIAFEKLEIDEILGAPGGAKIGKIQGKDVRIGKIGGNGENPPKR